MRKKNERLLGFQWGGTIVVTIECYLKCFNSLNQLEKSDETKNLLKNQNVKALTTGKTHFGDAVCKLLEWPKKKPQKYRKKHGKLGNPSTQTTESPDFECSFPFKKKKENGKPQQMTRKSAFGNDIICWVKTRQVAYITLSQPMIPYQIKVKFRESTSMTWYNKAVKKKKQLPSQQVAPCCHTRPPHPRSLWTIAGRRQCLCDPRLLPQVLFFPRNNP